MYIYICMYICISISISISMYMYMYIYMYVCVYIYICIHAACTHTYIYIMNTLRGLTSQQKTGMSATNMKILLTLFEYMFLDIPSASNRIGKMGYKRFSLLENMKYNNLTSVRHWNDG